ncbi:MAG TPA: hypothetical protein VNT75_31520 [Symbiobacteriaceae bacterium]|nr:hypothetical protein [Symbiobacteriaceae bacterium]
MLRGFFDRFGKRKDEANETAVIGNDGWVELQGGRLVVHDPAEDGRYATLTPEPGVRLWINDEEVTDPTAVTSSDRIRYDIAVDPAQFFELRLSEDEMSVEMLLTADPARLPDTVAVAGRHQVRLTPAYSTKARPRSGNARQQILDRLQAMGVEFGLQEWVLERELAAPSGSPVVIARGQEPQAPTPGHWVWRLDEWSMVEAGQVIAAYQDGAPNKPRITVKGQVTKVFDDIPEPHVYLAGNGTRLVPGGRLVASASGRARAVPTPQGQRVHIFPVERVEGDLTGELTAKADVIVLGNVFAAHVNITGEFLATGNVEKSEIHAEVISIRGHVSESKLCTVPPGHFVALRTEFQWMNQRIEAMREAIHNHRPITEEAFRDVQAFVRSVRRKAEHMGVDHPEYIACCEDIAKVFMGAQAQSGIDLPTAGRLLMALGKLLKVAELAVGARDVKAAAFAQVTVWAGRDITIGEKASVSSFFAGGAIRSGESAVISQAELVAASDVHVGILSSVRGAAPVNIRAGGRIEALQVQQGCAFEFGADRKEFKSDIDAVLAGINAKGQLIIRHKD